MSTRRCLLRLADLVRAALPIACLDLSTLSVQRRIYDELLRLARAAGVARNRARIDPRAPDAEMASLVSTYREQITRELSALVKAAVRLRRRAARWWCWMSKGCSASPPRPPRTELNFRCVNAHPRAGAIHKVQGVGDVFQDTSHRQVDRR